MDKPMNTPMSDEEMAAEITVSTQRIIRGTPIVGDKVVYVTEKWVQEIEKEVAELRGEIERLRNKYDIIEREGIVGLLNKLSAYRTGIEKAREAITFVIPHHNEKTLLGKGLRESLTHLNSLLEGK